MKTIRLLAGTLLLISGVLHIVAYFQAPESPGSIPVLAFGVIYVIVGALLFNRKKYPLYLAIIIPTTTYGCLRQQPLNETFYFFP